MSQKALQLIEENKLTKNSFLDLGNCGLTELPEQLLNCSWLKELNLGFNYLDKKGDFVRSQNYHDQNYIQFFNASDIKFLQGLTGLYLNSNEIKDSCFLNLLSNLTFLDLGGNQINDISFLSLFTNLNSLDLSDNPINNYSFISSLTNLESLTISRSHLKDISFLTPLIKLNYLCLAANEISDFSSLCSLRNLTSLDIRGNKISDCTFLHSLPQLNSLSFIATQLNDLSFLTHLPNLVSLDLSQNQISDISFLSLLSNLTYLNLGNNEISNISVLPSLTNINYLILSKNAITDYSFLSSLTHLEHLEISGGNIANANFLLTLFNITNLDLSLNQIDNISFLSHLHRLNFLMLAANKISEISCLSSLTNLNSLHLSGNQISNISSLSSLTNLNSLSLRENQIGNISSLSSLTNLNSLDLRYNQLRFFDFSLLTWLPNLSNLYLEGNPIQNIPPVVYNQYECLADLKIYIRDLKRGALRHYEAKLMLIGNGKVGKTCLIKRLTDNTFNKDEASTHAIQLRQWSLPKLAKNLSFENILINIWDFGGQDIYHATHRYFMHSQALFLLVWDSKTEQEPEQEERFKGKKIFFKNYRLPYWLSYIKTQSNNSSVVVVQTKRDRDGKKEPKLSEMEKREYNVVETLAVDSEKNIVNGFKALHEKIEELVLEQVNTTCTIIPALWHQVQQQIADLQRKGVRQISLIDFSIICKVKGLDESSAKTLLRFLHNSGVFFYQEGIFNNQIVIDQKWAIDAVYILFNRTGIFAELHGSGMFTGNDLKRKDVWKEYSEDEHQLFISFMEQCEVCFEMDKQNFQNKPFAERKFIAPQLLPEREPSEIGYIFNEKEGIYFKYRHHFLHAAIIQRLIVRIGFLAKISNMWKDGILLKTDEGTALVEALPEKNEMVIRLKELSSTELLIKIRNELKEIQQDEAGIEESVSLNGKTFVSLTALKNHRSSNEELQAEDSTWIKFDDYRLFLSEDDKLRFDKTKSVKPMPPITDNYPTIYFSYAWKDLANEDREKFVGDLYESLKRDASGKYKLRRDKEDVEYKESISTFMKEIGRGDLVVVAISDKYLKSEYCMYELHELYLNSKSNLEELREKIFPVRVERIDLTDPIVLDQYFEYWQQKEESWATLVKKQSSRISPQQQERYDKIKKIASDLGRFLDFIADMNTRTTELLEKDDFKEIKEAIQKRMKELNPIWPVQF